MPPEVHCAMWGDSGISPALAEVGVLGFVPDRWGPPWMPRHQVLSRLTKYFPTVWVDPMPYWHDRFRSSRDHADLSTGGTVPPPAGLEIVSGGLLGVEVGRPRLLADWLKSRHYSRAENTLRSRGCDLKIGYLWRPEFAAAFDLLNFDATCYHIDDEYSFSEQEQPLSEQESTVIRRADSVICHSGTLMRKKGVLNPNAEMIPNGVNWRLFATPTSEPSDLAGIPRPRIGYQGVVKRQIDLELILRLCVERPRWSFVFVGPTGYMGDRMSTWSKLAAMPNVRVLGQRPLSTLPGYAQHMDVNVMPYRVDDYTKYIYPLKLHEYLAAGRPVVSSPVPAVLEFNDVVQVAQGDLQWLECLERAVETTTDSAAARRRQETARPYDWDRIVARIAEALVRALGEEYVRRVRGASGY